MASKNIPTLVETHDLASYISISPSSLINPELLRVYAAKGQVDAPDKDGRTPLMIACWKGLPEQIIEFLLSNGANPKSTCTEEGNTPLHYACMLHESDKCLQIKPSKLSVVRLLLSHGAVAFQDNLHGWNALDVAALYQQKEVMEFLLSLDNIPDGAGSKASEIRGVSQALDLQRGKLRIDFLAHSAFTLTASFKRDATPSAEELVRWPLASCFAKISVKECHVLDKQTVIHRSVSGEQAHAFLVAGRLFPDHLKEKYIYPKLTRFARRLILNKNMLDESFEILSYALDFEGRGKLALGSVMGSLNKIQDKLPGSRVNTGRRLQFRQRARSLLALYESVLERAPADSLSDNLCALVESFGDAIFDETLYCSLYAHIDIAKSTLEAIDKSFATLRRRILEESPDKYTDMPSMTCHILKRLQATTDPNPRRGFPSSFLPAVKSIIRKLVRFENVSYKNGNTGNTVLHEVAICIVCTAGRDIGCFLDVARVYVRRGCPLNSVNDHGYTACGYLKDRFPEVLELLGPPTNALNLQEITIRTIIRDGVDYQRLLPTILRKMIDSHGFE